MTTTNDLMSKKEFKNGIIIYRSHRLKNGFISVTFAHKLNETTVTVSKKVEIEDKGGALTSLYFDKFLKDS